MHLHCGTIYQMILKKLLLLSTLKSAIKPQIFKHYESTLSERQWLWLHDHNFRFLTSKLLESAHNSQGVESFDPKKIQKSQFFDIC